MAQPPEGENARPHCCCPPSHRAAPSHRLLAASSFSCPRPHLRRTRSPSPPPLTPRARSPSTARDSFHLPAAHSPTAHSASSPLSARRPTPTRRRSTPAPPRPSTLVRPPKRLSPNLPVISLSTTDPRFDLSAFMSSRNQTHTHAVPQRAAPPRTSSRLLLSRPSPSPLHALPQDTRRPPLRPPPPFHIPRPASLLVAPCHNARHSCAASVDYPKYSRGSGQNLFIRTWRPRRHGHYGAARPST